jgi:hypothetical protein
MEEMNALVLWVLAPWLAAAWFLGVLPAPPREQRPVLHHPLHRQRGWWSALDGECNRAIGGLSCSRLPSSSSSPTISGELAGPRFGGWPDHRSRQISRSMIALPMTMAAPVMAPPPTSGAGGSRARNRCRVGRCRRRCGRVHLLTTCLPGAPALLQAAEPLEGAAH